VTPGVALARRLRAVGASLDEARVLAETVAAAEELLAVGRPVLLLTEDGRGFYPWRPLDEEGRHAYRPAPATLEALAAGVVRVTNGDLGARGAVTPPGTAELASGITDDGRLLGILTVRRLAPRAFSADEEAVLRELAAHAGAALGRARRHQAAARQAARVGVMARLGRRLAAPQPSADLLRVIVEETRRLLGASAATCHLADEGALRLAAVAGEWADAGGLPGTTARLAGRIVADGRPLRVRDAAPSAPDAVGEAAELAAHGLGEYLGAPVAGRDGVAGVLAVVRREGRSPGDEEAALLAGFAGLTSVVVENARLARELMEAERLAVVGRVMRGVAHEVSNPLAVVIGSTEILRRDVHDPHTVERLERIAGQARRAVRILRSLAALARRDGVTRGAVDVARLLDETLDLEAYELRSAGIEAVRRYEADLPSVLGDAPQLQQVFTHLLLNAVHAMREAGIRGAVTVTARHDRPAGRVVVAVADEGPGIAAGDLDRVFESFFATRSTGRGAGLGLAVCRQIVEGHEGQIRAESTPPTGATFVVTLPAMAEVPRPAAEAPAGRRGRTGPRALVVEDERVVGDLLAEFLGIEGYDVDRAENGREALELVRRGAYALIVSDVRMPDVDGPALYHELRSLAPELARRMVFVTGDVMSPDTRRFLDETCLRYLEKPFTIAEFQAVVRGVPDPSSGEASGRAG